MTGTNLSQADAERQGGHESALRAVLRQILRLKGMLYAHLTEEKITPLERASLGRIGMHLDRAEDACAELVNMQEAQARAGSQ